MLEEAVAVMRQLWEGATVNHHGRHYIVEHARIFSLPDQPPPVLVSGFGPKAIALAARIGDGFINTAPVPEVVDAYRDHGGRGPAVAAVKVCWGPDEAAARKLAFDRWAQTGVPGELNQELPAPEHFEQAASWSQRTWWPTRSCAAPTPNVMPTSSAAISRPATTRST